MAETSSWRKLGCTCTAPLTLLFLITLLHADIFWTTSFDRLKTVSSSKAGDQKPLKSLFARLVRGKDRRELESRGYACDVAENSIVCVSNRAVTIDTHNNISVYTPSITQETSVKPYALQKDDYLLQFITPVKILKLGRNEGPTCQHNHQLPAVIFSSGITNNLFHEFNDIIIPLFITIHHFKSNVQIILEDYDATFVKKYKKIFSQLSNYDVINPASNQSIHCFQGFVLGLKTHNILSLNSNDIPGGLSTRDFRLFIQQTYHLKFKHVSQIRKPTLMLLSREKSRKFLNLNGIASMIQELGFHIIVARTKEASNLDQFAHTINTCAVLVGVHGAGLTNGLFLPDGAVTVQVEPLGLEWASAHYFGDPAHEMGFQYLRYKIEADESSLVELYGRNHSVITDIESVYAKGYPAVRTVYLKQQNVRVNIERFRKTMIQALQLVQMHG